MCHQSAVTDCRSVDRSLLSSPIQFSHHLQLLLTHSPAVSFQRLLWTGQIRTGHSKAHPPISNCTYCIIIYILELSN